jgi:dUTP pyrophosphatase
MIKLKVKKLDPDAKIPSYANPGDAGMDIYSNENLVIRPGYRALVKTGISMEFPKNYAVLIWDKSGVAKKGIKTMAGVWDSCYRGECKVVLLNVGSEDYLVKKGDKIAQILIQPVVHAKIEETENLSNTKRGSGGFGSSGVN